MRQEEHLTSEQLEDVSLIANVRTHRLGNQARPVINRDIRSNFTTIGGERFNESLRQDPQSAAASVSARHSRGDRSDERGRSTFPDILRSVV